MAKKLIQIKSLKAGDFPPAVRPFWQNTPAGNFRLAFTLAAIVCYCALSPRLRVKYFFDMEKSMLLLNLLCIAPSGKGKSKFRWCINKLMAAQMIRDQEERRKLREVKEINKRKGSNKEKVDEPLVAIRFLQKFTVPVVTKYADFMYRRYGDWMSFFLFGDELAAFTENRRGNGDFQAVARTAYSLGETYSRDTLYQDGYNAMVDICWCSVICGQEQALEKYITKDGIVLGDAGRQILVKMGESIGDEAPEITSFTDEQERAVQEAVSTLMTETFSDDDQLMPIHNVDMSWMDKNVKAWCAQQRDIILMTGSRAHDSFYTRSSASAFRIATMLYHLWGEDPSKKKSVIRCYYFFAQFILDSAMAQWGQDYESTMPKDSDATVQKPTLYDLMPKRFTRDQLREMVLKQDLGTPARIFIFKWMKKKWIYEVEKDVYEKLYDGTV